jgi:hypothetical protein
VLRDTVHSACIVLLLLGSPGFSAKASQSDSYDYGQVPLPHAPVFQRGNKLSQPLSESDPAVKLFLQYYSAYVDQRIDAKLPKKLDKSDIVSFPSTRYSDIGPMPREYGEDLPQKDWQFATSSFCRDCHDATQALQDVNPPMRIPADHGLFANWSPYGEWSVSLMGLSGRDPAFHAQVETERLQHPGVDPAAIDNVCFSCHGTMGERQIHADLGINFDHKMIYSTPDNFSDAGEGKNYKASPKYAEYGALARDGVSCQVCHHIGPTDNQWRDARGDVKWEIFYGPKSAEVTRREGSEKPGPPYPFTANFQVNLNRLYVPDDIDTTQEPMLLLGMARAEQTPHIRSSEYCGGCHVVIVPKIPADYRKGGAVPNMPGTTYTGDPFTDPNVQLAYEQTTYFEFVNSGFPDKKIECQTCHMPGLQPAGQKVASLSPAWYTPENPDVPERDYKRHRILGINLFVHEMFQQFSDILGLADPHRDELVPEDTAANLLNAEQSIVQHATNGPFGEATAKVDIVKAVIADNTLDVDVTVTNNSGHKFPSGAGFRRGFIELQVLDAAGQLLWVSGKYNKFGVLIDHKGDALTSEFTRDPKQLQPHYQQITRQDQVQIYEVRTSEEHGILTTKTLSLFTDEKDNRILPNGWRPAALRKKNAERYGLNLQTLANITAAFAVGDDPDYSDPQRIGGDSLRYSIDLKSLKGKPAQVKAYMRYQTIPPYFLVDRYADGYIADQKRYGPATTRLIYLTSRLNTNLHLTSVTDSVNDFNVIADWTMTLSVDHAPLAPATEVARHSSSDRAGAAPATAPYMKKGEQP